MTITHRDLAVTLTAPAAAVLLAAGCAASAGGGDGPVDLGVIIERTGPLAALGLPELDAIKLAVKQVNQAGGVRGRTVRLVVRDSESQPAVAAAAAREFARRKDVPAVLGTATGAGCAAVNAVLEPKGVAQFCLSPIATRVKPLIFWAQGSLDDYHVFLTPYFAHKGMTRIALVRTADATGDAMEKIARDLVARDPKMTLTGVETFQSGATNAQTQLIRLREGRPDVVIAGASGANLLPIAQGMNALGMKMPLVVGHGAVVHSVLDLVKGSMVAGGMVAGVHWVNLPDAEIPASVPNRDLILKFRAAWQAEYGKPTGHSEAAAFDAAGQVLDALKAGAGTGKEIAAHIERTKFVGVLGDYAYTGSDHQGLGYVPGMLRFGGDGRFHLEYLAK
ncbi:ABC transporter substrate-binding protein [Actinomadura chibensis]|uniref:ABC transporter substrate-binding protein n=1 Tax=Actinomadura chibensis TaxID=392828 RepID=A0A5D0N9N2_9ACTN|nr:ABC transporter substrate-binding protein [Actinomadura chibensis]TYB41062.1 ABC transporter substrate-binding protein [Actinomadura chibensis]